MIKPLSNENVYGISKSIQPIIVYIICIIKFNITITCMLIFKNNWTLKINEHMAYHHLFIILLI